MSLPLKFTDYALIISLLVGCTGGCGGSAQEAARRQQAQEIWQMHEEVVARALRGHQEDDEFQTAVAFFAEVSGIEIDVEIFTLGYLPGAGATQDLREIRRWYANNKERLYFDQDTISVKVAPR